MTVDFDDILKKYVGSFMKYQKRRVAIIAILVSVIFINSSFGSVFIAYEPDHHCKIPSQLQSFNCSEEEIKTFVIPRDDLVNVLHLKEI